ncbi:hypothetical protein FV232_22305 [Methylobacterium sp. WL30]|uniref:hypothetical protein n=1 Tax=unclassified Methylobacterium TaxID=2615210 RepID=UPI0011CC081B|nr:MULTISPECIES: hypothetical protein [unclassified Methylobacterium]TXM93932.1 hypothetical protein FV223_06575 [Methylobacterium sp. WL116]TXN41400.1 hypothetical protein FV225_02620 [Methylobacterium sp. WL93]TXN49782.1 hypothetical protein FV227_14910 [Methylobacterium sp. WL119]TXN63830.1 hypothetical protein FV232_22305 [Methylobacterium sp. WL30]
MLQLGQVVAAGKSYIAGGANGRAKRRRTDEYDAAQERGEVQGHGGQGRRDVPDGNIPAATVTDLGLTRKAVHEARQIRDAQVSDPGLIRRTPDAYQ